MRELSVSPFLNEADQTGPDTGSDVFGQHRIRVVLFRAPQALVEVDCLGHRHQVVGDVEVERLKVVEVAMERKIE